MAEDSKISWTDHTANLWWGCVEVSPLCDHCYAREWAKRYDRAKWGANEPRLAVKSVWTDLAKFQRNAAAAGRVDRVFVGSMMDIFEKRMPVVDGKGEPTGGDTGDLRQRLFQEVVPASPNLLFLLLTKRPGNISGLIPQEWRRDPPPNVMFGTSVGTCEGLKAVDQLREAPGRRFLSCEPLLEDLGVFNLGGIHWVIGGGESGPHARPMHPRWARGLRDLCGAAGVPYHFKQWGEFGPEQVGAIRHTPVHSGVAMDEPAGMFRVGVKTAGRVLDGRTHDYVPTIGVRQ